MEEDPISIFFNSILLPATPIASQKDNRLRKNCQLVQKFLGNSEAQRPDFPAQISKKIVKDDVPKVQVESQSQDSLAFAYYDKLWASSKHHKCLLSSQWTCLLEKVEEQGPEYNSFYLSSEHVCGILFLCEALDTSFIIRFRALELYNRYLKLFARKHQEFVNSCNKAEVKEFKVRFESQVFLRMCTCIMIASKLHADTQIRAITTEKVRGLLLAEGFEFTRNNIARSEIRVMETLDYRCLFVTPLEVMEQLLCILNLQLEFLKRAHYFCILLLEYCYSDWDNIRDRYMISIKKSQRFTVSQGKISLPLLSAAIVGSSLFIVSAEMKTKTQPHKVVAKTANLNEEDVHILAVLLLDLLNVS